ncbi:MAG TPA: dihydropteroate synthase [Bacteroidales bacterium]|nr:dihydropteroate synthase [Bacteroidales bacterium]
MKSSLNIRGKLFDLSIPRVMGIMNITPDSFFKGSRTSSGKAIRERITKMIDEGAEIIDIGGFSSRPDAEDISVSEEKKRISGALEIIRDLNNDIIISVDTFRAEVARMAVEDWGADMINDISGGILDPDMVDFIAKANLPFIIMHMQGTPATMQISPTYDNVVHDLISWFSGRLNTLYKKGVKDIIVDPGFGFGKTVEHNYQILANLRSFNIFDLPVMVGISRKSMIWKELDISPDEALPGTIALNTFALLNGASILRVHDVKEAVHAVKLVGRLNSINAKK